MKKRLRKKEVFFLVLLLSTLVSFLFLSGIGDSENNWQPAGSAVDTYLGDYLGLDGKIYELHKAVIYARSVAVESEHSDIFTDYAKFDWSDDLSSFIFEYNDIKVGIKPYIVDTEENYLSVNEVLKHYPKVRFFDEVTTDTSFKYGFIFENIPAVFRKRIKNIALKIENLNSGSELKIERNGGMITLNDDILLFFDDIRKDGLNYEIDDSSTVIISGVSGRKSIYVDPIISLKKSNVSQDGDINLENGVYTRDSTYTVFRVGRTSPTLYYRSYLEFNVTFLNDSAYVLNLSLNISFTGKGSYPCDINSIESRPTSASNSNLYDDIGDGTSYVNNDNFCSDSGYYKKIDLGKQAILDFEGRLDDNWFGVGLKWDDESNVGSMAYIYSSDCGYLYPALEVVYLVPKIEFVNPTPANSSNQSGRFIEVNISAVVRDLTNLSFRWDGINYTFFDSSLILMYNLDRLSILGENETFVRDMSLFGNNGTAIISGFVSSGRFRKGAKLDGVNDYIVTNRISGFFSDDGSFSIWVRSNLSWSNNGNFTIFSYPGEQSLNYSDCLAYLDFNHLGVVGSPLEDRCSFNNDGTVDGDPQYKHDGGRFSGAYEFDRGPTPTLYDHIDLPNTQIGIINANRTYEFWFKANSSFFNSTNLPRDPSPFGGPDFLYDQGDFSDSVTELAIWVNNEDRRLMEFYVSPTSDNSDRTVASFNWGNDTLWHHVAAVLDIYGNKQYIYYDGELVAENITRIPQGGFTTFYQPRIAMQAKAGDTERRFEGMMDEFRVWNRTLSVREIRAHYLGALSIHKNCEDIEFSAGNVTLTYNVSHLSANEWHYISATYSLLGANLFLDGVNVNSSGIVGSMRRTGNQSVFGAPLNFSNFTVFKGMEKWSFNGTIDEPRIWSRALSFSEVNLSYYSDFYRAGEYEWVLWINKSLGGGGLHKMQAFAGGKSGLSVSTEERSIVRV